ncbi:MAG: 2-oxo acid dehydrogenase subunit E2, partial [candidate division WOR-3 bacterium]
LLSEKARKRELNLEDVQGGTFSITNIGSIGGLFSFPVINYPQVAILGFHSIKKRPVINERGEIVIRDMVYLSLSFDHRVIDGAEAALFMKDLIKYLETPELLFLESI